MNKDTLQEYSCILQNYLVDQGMSFEWAIFLNVVVNCVIVFVAAIVLDVFFRRIIIEAFKTFSNKTKTTFDDYLILSNFPKYIAHLIPLSILRYVIPIIFIESPWIPNILLIAVKVALVITYILIFRSILRTIRNFAEETEKYKTILWKAMCRY